VAIQWLRNFKEPTGQLARWLERLAEFDFVVQHRPGRKHTNADALSRKPQEISCVMENTNDIYDKNNIDQQSDRILQQVLNWVSSGKRPTIDENTTLNKEGRTLWSRFDELAIVDNKLCLISTVDDKSSAKIIPPTNIREEIIDNYHAGVGGGHLAFEKTYLKIKDRFYWPNMKEDIKVRCYSCKRCGARKGA